MRIREMDGNDADGYRVLRLRALKQHPTAFSSSYEQQRDWPVERFGERLRRVFASPNAFTLGCFVDEGLIGTIGLFREENPKESHKATIVGMHIAAEHQRKGYGRALLVAALDRARHMQGLSIILLAVESTNEPAKSLYASHGFETYGVERRAMFVGGEYFDQEFMALELK